MIELAENIREAMKVKERAFQNSIMLFIITLTIVFGSLFFGARESLELSENFVETAFNDAVDTSMPMTRSVLIKASECTIVSVAEVRDVKVVSEVIKRLEKSENTKRVVILTLIICLIISGGAFFKAVLPSIFPWSDVILSRSRIICYIQDKDGEK